LRGVGRGGIVRKKSIDGSGKMWIVRKGSFERSGKRIKQVG